MDNIKKAKAVQDNDGHWFVIPLELSNDFWKDCQDDLMIDMGEFWDKYGKYSTGGDLNLKQLWAEF